MIKLRISRNSRFILYNRVLSALDLSVDRFPLFIDSTEQFGHRRVDPPIDLAGKEIAHRRERQVLRNLLDCVYFV